MMAFGGIADWRLSGHVRVDALVIGRFMVGLGNSLTVNCLSSDRLL